MPSAWIGLGSNQGQTATNLLSALRALDRLPRTRVLQVSDAYRTPPWGVTDQDDFLNAVVELETDLTPDDLLTALLRIEASLGRVRTGPRWGPRLLDLDLLVFDDHVLDTPRLTLPHPRLQERAFVLVPLDQLAPELVIPGLGCVRELLEALPDSDRGDIQRLGCLDDQREP